MQHETSMFPASLGDPFEYPMTSTYQNKGWSSFGELEFEINPCNTLNMIDEEERTNSVFNSIDAASSSDASCPQFSSVSNGLNTITSTLSMDGNITANGANSMIMDLERVGPSWYHDNVDINQLLGDDLKFEPINVTTTGSFPSSSETSDISKVLPSVEDQQSNNFTAVTTTAALSNTSPTPTSTLTQQQEVNIKKRKKNENEGEEKDKKKKEVNKKKKTQVQIQIQQEIEESYETDNDNDSGGDNSGTQPKLTRKEKNKLAAQKYRAKQRNEASDVAKRCDKFVSENAQLRGEIETTRKQIEEYKKLLAQFNSPNGFF